MRFRNIYIIIGSLLVILLWMLTDPDSGIIQHLPIGAGTIATLVILSKSILYVAVLHVSRKALFDYFDLQTAINKAVKTETGAGLVVVGISIAMLALAITIYAATNA